MLGLLRVTGPYGAVIPFSLSSWYLLLGLMDRCGVNGSLDLELLPVGFKFLFITLSTLTFLLESLLDSLYNPGGRLSEFGILSSPIPLCGSSSSSLCFIPVGFSSFVRSGFLPKLLSVRCFRPASIMVSTIPG